MLFRIGRLGVTYGWGGAVVKKVSLPDTVTRILQRETLHSYTLPKKDPKNI